MDKKISKKIVILEHMSEDGMGPPVGYTYIEGSTIEEVKAEFERLLGTGWEEVLWMSIHEHPILSLQEFLKGRERRTESAS